MVQVSATYSNKKLKYRAQYRGTLELGNILGAYVSKGIDDFDDVRRATIADFLGESDHEIQLWLLGLDDAPEHYRSLVTAIQQFAENPEQFL